MLDLSEQKQIDLETTDNTKGLEVVSFPSQLRGAYVYTDDQNKKTVCSEPFTDVGASSTINASAKAANNLSLIAVDTENVSEQSVELGMQAINQIVSLEGRTQYVLLAREMLFRICEAAANGFYDPQAYSVADQQIQVINAMTAMIKAQEAVAKAEKEKSTLEIVKKTKGNVSAWIDKNQLDIIVESYKDDLILCLKNAKDKTATDKCQTDYDAALKALN